MQIHKEQTKKEYRVLGMINYNELEADVWLQNIKEKIVSISHKWLWKWGVYSMDVGYFIS